MNAWQLLPAIRDLYSRHPEMYSLEAWELQSALFVLGYTDDLADEALRIRGGRREYPDARHPHARYLARYRGVLPVPLRRRAPVSGPRGLPDFGALVVGLRRLRRGDAHEALAVRGFVSTEAATGRHIPPRWNLYLPRSSRATLKKMNLSLKRGIMQGQTLVCSRRPCC